MRLRTLVLAAMLFPAAAYADEFDGKPSLSNTDKANIAADQDEAHKAIDDKYKDDDSSSARAAKQKEYREADQQAYEKRGLSEKDYMWQNSHNSPDDRRDIDTQKSGIEEKRKADKEAAAKKAAEPAEATPQVVKGFDDNHPLDVERGEGQPGEAPPPPPQKPQVDENGNPVPTVEKLDPKDDPNATPGADGTGGGEAAPPKKDLSNTAIKPGGHGHKRHKSSDE